MHALIVTFRRLPGAIADTAVWGWHHPAAVIVLGMCSLAFGAFCYVSTRFHRRPAVYLDAEERPRDRQGRFLPKGD